MLARWFNCLILGLITLLNFSAVTAVAATGKKNVCAMTINSNDEINLFKKHLSPEQFNFIELTEKGSDSDWLRASCKENINCDILVISGHFGGAFFGSSGLKLPLEQLEAASCDSSCSGILHRPKEVFLFGCNTLAGKEKDARTPEQYVRVLMEDGFSRQQAQQIAAFRYSPMGSSFNDRMSRIFAKVPRIYGFSSIAPSGKTIAPHLGGYLKDAASTYFEKLTTMATEPNTTLINRLKGQPFVQTKGAENVTSPVCYIENENTSTIAKLKYTLDVLDFGGVLELAPYLSRYFKNLDEKNLNPAERRLLQDIHAHSAGRDKLETFIAKPIPGLLKPQIETLNLMRNINWVSEKKYNQYLEAWILDPLFKDTITRDAVDRICSLDVKVPSIDPQKINRLLWSQPLFYEVITCLNPTNTDFLKSMAKHVEGGNNVDEITRFISRNVVSSDDLRISLEKFYANGGKQSHDAFTLKQAILIAAHKDEAYLFSKLEEYFKNPKNAEFAFFGGVSQYSHALYDRINQEIFNPRSPEHLRTAISMDPSGRTSPELQSRFLEIITGDYPLNTQLAALSTLEMQTYRTPSHTVFLKDILKSNANYQMKRQVLYRIMSNFNYESEVHAIIESQNDSFLMKAFELIRQTYTTKKPTAPYHVDFNHHLFMADFGSPFLQSLNSGEIPYILEETPYAYEDRILHRVSIIIGLRNKNEKNGLSNYQQNLAIYNAQTKRIVGLYPYHNLAEYNLEQFGNLFFSTALMNQSRLIITALVNDPKTGSLQQDYSAAILQAQKNLISQLKAQSPEYKNIIEGNVFLAANLEQTRTGATQIILTSKGELVTLEAKGIIKFSPGSAGLGSVSIEGLEISRSPNK